MQTQHIVSFYHVARLRSITKAADVQGLAQPTVTSHLKKLEEELGVSLFDRIKRPIMLTSDGVAVLEMVAPIVPHVCSAAVEGPHDRRSDRL